MVANPPNGTPRVVARLGYDDPDAAVAYLDEAFGFPERNHARIATPGGAIVLTEVQVLDSLIMLGATGSHGISSPASTGAATQALIVYVDSVDDHYARAKAAGATIISEPEDQFWGDRSFTIKDCNNYFIAFNQMIPK